MGQRQCYERYLFENSPSAILLNKVPKSVPVTQGQDRIYVCLAWPTDERYKSTDSRSARKITKKRKKEKKPHIYRKLMAKRIS